MTNLDSLAKEMLKTRIVKCKSVDHGKMYESTAVSKYEEITGNHSTECRMVICKDYPFLASSPDGLVNDNIVVEVKCPYSARHSEINSSTVNYVLEGVNGLELDKEYHYYYQVQGQMMCTGRGMCDFIIYTFKDVKVFRIEKNVDFNSNMTNKLEYFYKDHFR